MTALGKESGHLSRLGLAALVMTVCSLFAGCGAIEAGVGVLGAASSGAEAIGESISRPSTTTTRDAVMRAVTHRDPPPVDLSAGIETSEISGFADGSSYCHISQPATTRSLVVDEGEMALTAVCNFLRPKKTLWFEINARAFVSSKFDFRALPGHRYRVELRPEALATLTVAVEDSATEAVVDAGSVACVSLVDETEGELVACEPAIELPNFNGSNQMATGDATVEIRGGSYLCGISSLLFPGEYQSVVLDAGRARITAYCYKPGLVPKDGGFYYAKFDLSSLPGETYLVWREDETEDDAEIVSEERDCMVSLDTSQEMRIFVCKA
jgi:hypothetical protein